jgi:spore germination cell wall hydrolase CwlJ-like protein
MYWRYRWTHLWLSLGWELAHWRRRFALFWYGGNKAPWLFVFVAGLVVAGLAFALYTAIAYQDERRKRVREFHKQSLTCLALNVYFEARGEPVAGQYAVAEVTMNRKASGIYPNTVCGVVYERSAFSWTAVDLMPEPEGEAWTRAQEIADEVYYGRHTPVLNGALFFHATYVKPDWAAERRRVARIGNHVFYR